MEIKLIKKIYRNHDEFVNDLKRIKILLSAKSEYINSLFENEEKYVSYYKKINLIKYFYNKVHIFVYLNEIIENDIDYSKQDLDNLEQDVMVFLHDLRDIEKINIDKLRKFNFSSENMIIYEHISGLDDWVDIDEHIYNFLKDDIDYIQKSIGNSDYNLLELYLKKSKQKYNIKGYNNELDYKLSKNRFCSKKDVPQFYKVIKQAISTSEIELERMFNSIENVNKDYEFDFKSQKLVLSTSQQIINDELFEVFEELSGNIISNKKINKISYDSKLETIILLKNDNTFNGYLNYLKLMSKAIHLQYAKFYNHYEFAHVNYFDKNSNFWFNFLISDAVMQEVSDENQKIEVRNIFSNYLIFEYSKALQNVYTSLCISENSNLNSINEAFNAFNFDNYFVDDLNFDTKKAVELSSDISGLKSLMSIFVGILMFINLDDNDNYINNIINYYKNGTKVTFVEGLEKLNIDIFDLHDHKKVLKFITDRSNNDK